MDFIIILIGHWVGDFLFQTTNMATKKHNKIKWLLLHGLVYTVILLVCLQFVFSWQVSLGFAVLNGVLHTAIDAVTSKISFKYLEKPRVFYPILGFDQMLHIICLYWSFLNSDILAL